MSSKIFGPKGLFFLVLIFLWSPTSFAELYYYRDAQGVIHITDTPFGDHWRPYHLSRFSKARVTEDLFRRAGRRFGLDPRLLKAIARAESAFDPEAVSPKGALGLMQLMPETARLYGVQDPFDPEENVMAAAAYLRDLLDYFQDLILALAAYNAGPQRVIQAQGLPPLPETRSFVTKVLRFWQGYRSSKELKFLTKNP